MTMRERERERERERIKYVLMMQKISVGHIQEEFWKKYNIQEHSIRVALVCGVCQSFFVS